MPFRSDQLDSRSPEEALAILDSEMDPPPRELVREFVAALDALSARYSEGRRQIAEALVAAWRVLAAESQPTSALLIARDLAAAAKEPGAASIDEAVAQYLAGRISLDLPPQ